MKSYIIYLTAILMFALSGCRHDDDTPSDNQQKNETITLNVDVVLPQSVRSQWQTSIDMALENLNKAQQKQPRKINLNLRYHDEDTEDLDKLSYALTHPEKGDDTCHAIIGPYHSVNAPTILRYAKRNRLPVVMPTCTSSELQRTNARNTYAWFLTESDITQCEIMISAAHAMKASDIALVYSDDTYGQSFRDWFGYYAAEQGIHIAGGSRGYKKGDDISAFMKEVVGDVQGNDLRVLVALSDAADYKAVCDQCVAGVVYKNDINISTICSDTSLDQDLFAIDDFYTFGVGVCPSGSMVYGFPQAYEGSFLDEPLNGFAQMYDALCIIALGAAHQAASPDRCIVDGKQVEYTEKPYSATLTDYMRSVVSCEDGMPTQWDAAGLALAFSELGAGRNVAVTGATGALYFDKDTHTKILNTTYKLWRFNWSAEFATEDPYFRLEPIIYLSTAGTSSEASTTEIWRVEKTLHQDISEDFEQHLLPEATDNWAVIISPSTTWSNYRHQADAFAMYQLVKKHGYDDDHIVLIAEDNLADDSRNIFPGKIFVERSGNAMTEGALVDVDVRENSVVDYHFSDLTPDDLADILLGNKSDRLPHVISPKNTSNVFFFWSGHGGSREGPLWGNEDATRYFGTDRIRNIVSQMNADDKYRRMMFAIETCYSGKWGEALQGLPDVLVLTAANSNEYSMADVHDKDLGVYLSNAFARTFRTYVDTKPDITIYDLYRELYRATNGSHVTIYNQQQYGSVYTEGINEYFN